MYRFRPVSNHLSLPARRFSSCRVSRSPSALYGADATSDFLERFLSERKAPQESIDHFCGIEWARGVLQDKAYEPVPFFSRYPNEETGENAFFGRTVSTGTTIPHLLSLRRRDLKTPEPGSHPQAAPNSEDEGQPPEVICLMTLGRGLESHPTIVHGGFQCVMFDEVIRFLILLHQNQIRKPGHRESHLTVKMDVSYHKPVAAPSTVMARSRLLRRDGRKWLSEAAIVDGAGATLTSATSLWVTARTET